MKILPLILAATIFGVCNVAQAVPTRSLIKIAYTGTSGQLVLVQGMDVAPSRLENCRVGVRASVSYEGEQTTQALRTVALFRVRSKVVRLRSLNLRGVVDSQTAQRAQVNVQTRTTCRNSRGRILSTVTSNPDARIVACGKGQRGNSPALFLRNVATTLKVYRTQ